IWKMMPKCSARKPSRAEAGSLVMSVPRMWIAPTCGATMPQMRLRNVDLPLPEGPTSSTRLPRASAKLSTASEKEVRPGQAKRTPDRRITSDGAGCGVTAATTIARSDHAGEAEAGLGPRHLEPALGLRGDDVDLEPLGTRKGPEVGEFDAGDAGRGLAVERVLGMKLGVALALGRPLCLPASFDLDLGLDHAAARRGRQDEEGERLHKLALGLLDRCLVTFRRGRVLEAHDVRSRRLELHGHSAAFDGDAERAAPVLVGAELAMGRGGQ